MIKLLTLSLFLFSVFTACSQDVSSRSYERYKILAERNIYVKDRMPQPELSRVPRPILREASVPVYRRTLTGIVNYGSEYTAFFEDSSRKTYRVGTVSYTHLTLPTN